MTNNRWKMMGLFIFIMAGLLVAPGAAGAALQAVPDTLTFRDRGESALIVLEKDGEDLAPEVLQDYAFMVSDTNYDHMISVKPSGDCLLVAPTRHAEVGRFTLVLKTSKGTAEVEVFTPLSHELDIVEKRAIATGRSIPAVKRELGLVTQSPHSYLVLDVPEIYYVGQAVTLEMPEKNSDSCAWKVNGITLAEGPDAYEFTYVFPQAGYYVIEFQQRQGGRVIASTYDGTVAVPLPALYIETEAGTKLDIPGPEGYEMCIWRVDGIPMLETGDFDHRFDSPGDHVIECHAKNPANGPKEAFYHAQYLLHVNPAT